MKSNIAAGLLMCRTMKGAPEFFLVHPGGPYFRKKEAGVWSIPKGVPEAGESLIDTARREFFEETGIRSGDPLYTLGSIKQKGGKTVHAWAFKGTWEPADGIVCNTFTIAWPPGSGTLTDFPEVDKAAWMDYDAAVTAMIPAQIPFLDRALNILVGHVPGSR